jgi:hypothetical protein
MRTEQDIVTGFTRAAPATALPALRIERLERNWSGLMRGPCLSVVWSRAKRKPTKKLTPMHPGEVLREEYLVPLNISPGRLTKACGIPRTRIGHRR